MYRVLEATVAYATLICTFYYYYYYGDTTDIAKYLVIIDNKVTTSGLDWRAVVKVPICHLLNGTSHVATAANTKKQHILHGIIRTKTQLRKMNEMKVQ